MTLSSCCKAPAENRVIDQDTFCTSCNRICDLQPPAESGIEFVEVTPDLQKKMDAVMDKWDKSQTPIRELIARHERLLTDAARHWLTEEQLREQKALLDSLRLALDGLEKIAAKYNYDSLIAKNALAQIQLLTPKHETL